MSAAHASTARAATAHWGFGPAAEITGLCVSENVTLRVREAGADAVLRLHRPGYHSRPEIAAELAWSQALRADGVCRTPRAWRTRDGQPVAEVAGTYATLFDHVPGAAPGPDDPAGGMQAIGALAARLHVHSRSWRPPPGFARFRWDLPAALGTPHGPGRWGSWRSAVSGLGAADVTLMTDAEERVRAELTGYGTAPDRFGLVHADLRAANLLVSGTAEVTVLDFDDCGWSWFWYDLAASVSFLEHTAELPDLVTRWLDGYRTVAEPAGSPPLAALVTLRRLQLLAWSAGHAQTAMVRSLGPDFAAGSAAVAERYLAGRLLTGVG